MNVTVLCSSREHPIFPVLQKWVADRLPLGRFSLATQLSEVGSGDLLFLISCHEIVTREVRSRFRSTLVVHASDLPQGRGWSPHVWQILDGANVIPVTLLEAEDAVDSGAIWHQLSFSLEGHELYEEINAKLFQATLDLLDFALDRFDSIRPLPQPQKPATYYRKRTQEDSRLDPQKSIEEQFQLLRVSDPKRFPCFFERDGVRYELTIRKTTR